MNNCISSLILLLSKHHFWCLVVFLFLVYLLNFICWWHEYKSWKTLFDEMFFLVYGFEYEWKLSLRTDWLMSQGSLRPLCHSCECSCCLGFYWGQISTPKSLSSCSVWTLFYLAHLLFTFQTVLQTLELFLFFAFSDFLWHLWQVYSLFSVF